MFEKWWTQKKWVQDTFGVIAVVAIIGAIIWCFKLYGLYRDRTLPSEEELIQINSNVPGYWWEHDCFLAYDYMFKQRSQLRFWENWWDYICSEKSSSCMKKITEYWYLNSTYYWLKGNVRYCVTEGLSKVREVDLSKIESKVKQTTKDIEEFINSSMIKYDSEDYEWAIEDLNKAITLDPTDTATYYLRGLAKNMVHDYKGAIQDFNKTIELDPKNIIAYGNRGLVKYDSEDYEWAIEDFDRMIELDPTNAIAYGKRGMIKTDMDNYEGAIQDFDKAIELNIKDASIYQLRGTIKIRLLNLKEGCADIAIALDLDKTLSSTIFEKFCK